MTGFKKRKYPKKAVSYDTAEIERLKDTLVRCFIQGKEGEGNIKLKELCDFQKDSPSYLSMSLSDVAHRIFESRGLFDKAVEIYELAVNKNKKDKVPWCGLGAIYKAKRKYETALEKYEEAQSLDPSSVVPLNGMAEVHKAMGQFDMALEKYEEAQLLNPSDVVTLSGMAEVHKAMGQFDMALEKYKEAQSLDPSDVVSWNGMAGVYKAMGRFQDAENCYLYANKNFAQNYYGYCGLGFLWLKVKPEEKLIECKRLFEKALNVDPANPIINLGREVVNGLLNQSAIKELADQKWFERTLSFLNKDQSAESRKHVSFLKNLETADLRDSEIRRETMSGLGDTGSYLLEEMVL